MTGIALPITDLPVHLLELPHVACRVHEREGRREVQFHWQQTPTVLPVWWEGRLRLLPWGSKDRRCPLPMGGWVSRDTVESGEFAGSAPERVVIPAVLGFDAGTWFLISEGVRGVVIPGRNGPVVYIVTVPSSNYYRNMTQQQARMPVFVNQTI